MSDTPASVRLKTSLLLAGAAIGMASIGWAQSDSSVDPRQAPMIPYAQLMAEMPEVPLSQLSDQTISANGRRALAIDPQNWKHGETNNFVLHFIHNYVAKSVGLEAEAYFRYITADLGITPEPGAKCHIYIFEDSQAWQTFVQSAQLEKWTGGVTIGNELFITRDPKAKFNGHTLAHEVTHLVVHRFLGTRLPLWLEEGYAEDMSLCAYGSFYRRRGYTGKPVKPMLRGFIPLSRLCSLTEYPPDQEVETFYIESNWLAGYLNNFGNQQSFIKMFRAAAQGMPFESAMREGYGSRWLSLDDLEVALKKFLGPVLSQPQS